MYRYMQTRQHMQLRKIIDPTNIFLTVCSFSTRQLTWNLGDHDLRRDSESDFDNVVIETQSWVETVIPDISVAKRLFFKFEPASLRQNYQRYF